MVSNIFATLSKWLNVGMQSGIVTRAPSWLGRPLLHNRRLFEKILFLLMQLSDCGPL